MLIPLYFHGAPGVFYYTNCYKFKTKYTRIYVCAMDSDNVLTNVELLVDNAFGFGPILCVSDIDPYHSYVRFGKCFNNLSQNNIIENIEFFGYFFN